MYDLRDEITIKRKLFWRVWTLILIFVVFIIIPIYFLYEGQYGLTALFFFSLCTLTFRFIHPLFFKLSVTQTDFTITDLVISYEKIHLSTDKIPFENILEYAFQNKTSSADIHILVTTKDGKKHKLISTNRHFKDAEPIFKNIYKELVNLLSS